MEENGKLDNRQICKYGEKCYQKNEEHHKKFKHIEKRKPNDEPSNVGNVKKIRLDEIPNSVNSSKPLRKAEIEIPGSPDDIKENIRSKFLVEMPDEFYSFWDFCKSLSPDNPSEALSNCGLRLVGPFDVLSGALKRGDFTSKQLLRHWRYYYDPPEFQTLIQGDNKSEFHIGYFRDDPKEYPAFVGSNSSAEGCVIKSIGPTLFTAFGSYLSKKLKSSDPFQKMKVIKIQTALESWMKEHVQLQAPKKNLDARNRKIVCPGFHKAGIVVPFDKKTKLGYRELESEFDLRRILNHIANAKTPEGIEDRMERLDNIVTYANIANDECDFGASLELGLNIFCYGEKLFHPTILGVLRSAYTLLGREPFAQILEAHLEDRKKGVQLSIIPINN